MCSEHALSLIQSLVAKRQRSCVAQSVEQSPGLREVPGFESRHSRSMFFCYIGDPDVMGKLCYDHIPPHPSAQTTSCYDRTTNFRMHCMFLSHSVFHQGDLCSGFHLHTICVSEHALSLIQSLVAKRQRSCVAQSVEQSPGLREVLGSNPGTADQCFSAYNRINSG